MLVWRETSMLTPGDVFHWRLMTAEVQRGEVTPSESVGVIGINGFCDVQSGTQRGRRRWIASSDYSPEGGEQVSLFCKVEGRGWRPLPVPLASRNSIGGCPDVVALSDSSALAVYNAGQYLDWGVISDTGWVRPPEHLQSDYTLDALHLRPNQDGSVWLRYGKNDTITFMRRFRNMAWSSEDTLRWAFPTSDEHITIVGPMSLDDRPLPVLTGAAYSVRDGVVSAYVNVPADNGYGRFQRIPDSEEALNVSAVTRDENGDVWLAWWKYYDGLFWVHTYTRATSSTPSLHESDGRPFVTWTLSEPAPGSMWSVLRSANGGPESPVARLTATDGTNLAWTDHDLRADASARYRLRRECRDVRYQWISQASAEWLPRTPMLGLTVRSANPASGIFSAEVTGANAGRLTLASYDLQGRQVARSVGSAAGTGRDVIQISFGAEVPSGLYFLRAESERGVKSAVERVVLVR
jgi:hypothetical protein